MSESALIIFLGINYTTSCLQNNDDGYWRRSDANITITADDYLNFAALGREPV